MRKMLMCAAIAAFGAMPAHAAPADVTLDVTLLEPFVAVPVAGTCAVSIPEGADGFEVLDAALGSGCIGSYEATGSENDPFGRFLVCVNDVCDPTGDGTALYWRFGVNGQAASVGLDQFEAADRDALSVSLTTWAGCLADASLC